MNDSAEIRAMLVDTAERVFADHCAQRNVEDAKKSGWSEALWQVLEHTQLTLVSVAEERGGAGGSLPDLGAVLRVAGRYSAPVPLAESAMLAGWMLAGSGLQVPAGPIAAGPSGHDRAPILERDGPRWMLSGQFRRMPWARIATRFAVIAEYDGETYVASVDPARCTIRPGFNLAWEPRDDVTSDRVALRADDVVPAGPGITRHALLERGALARAVLMVGALDRALELSIAHAQTRVQFGRAIAKFQAIQQELARFADEVAAAAAAAMSALGAIERGDPGIAVACAKLRAGEAANTGAGIAHQIHAAIGVTEEYVLHHSTLRLQAWRSEFGSEGEWGEWLGEKILTAGADKLWPTLAESL
jgi:acyl-CoA dehydrogenase